MNPIVLALIGFPVLAGIYFRFTLFDYDRMIASARIQGLVFLAVGVGFVFMTSTDPNPFFTSSWTSMILCGISFVVCYFSIIPAVDALSFSDGFVNKVAEFIAASLFLTGLFCLPFVLLFLWWGLQYFGFITAAYTMNVLYVFILFGIVNALFGTIASGFTISASVHAFMIGKGLPDVYIWKDIFEFLDISSAPIQFLLLIAMALASAGEAISTFLE
ncbi:MAG: hypothetical protein MRJ68_16510 [Nitrospira sp.]|nr:hypothetical protein [Nitrospira sp.]